MTTKIFAGNSNPALAKAVAKQLGVRLGDVLADKFNDGECRVQVKESVRGKRAFAFQSTCAPVNDTLMELLVMVHALKLSSASKVFAVLPYFGYARQDYQMHNREPVTARLVADLLEKAGANSILTVDIHSPKMQGFFSVPFDNVPTTGLASDYLKAKLDLAEDNCVIVSPDAGGVKRAQDFADRIPAPIAIIHKRRSEPGEARATHLVGDVKGKKCVMVDDMIDTGGSILRAATLLKENGAESVSAYCTHAVLSKDAADKIEAAAELDRLVVTDTIPLKKTKKIEVVSVAPLLAKIINALDRDESISPFLE